MAVFGQGSQPTRPARRDRQRTFSMADKANVALQDLLIDNRVVTSCKDDSRCAIAHESGSPIGLPNDA